MAPAPSWVKALKPSGPQGSELLKQERDGSNVDVTAISEFLHSKAELEQRSRVLKVLENEKIFNKSQNYFSGRLERFETSLARAKRLKQLTVEKKWSQRDFQIANELISEPTPYGLHDSMFVVSLLVFTVKNVYQPSKDYLQGPRISRTARKVPQAGREPQDYRLLCTDRAWSWLKRQGFGDDGNVEFR